MNGEEFAKLYTRQDSDETITPFQNEAGFSLIRFYPKDTPYFKDGRRMFIKIVELDRGFFYGVDMTKPQKRDEATEYVITDGEEDRKKATKFIFWRSDKHYGRVKTAIDKYHFNQKQTYSKEKITDVDPFFKYFLIYRNTLFIGLIVALSVAVFVGQSNILDEFTVANPLI